MSSKRAFLAVVALVILVGTASAAGVAESLGSSARAPAIGAHQAMPPLKGEAALDYLKQHGLYDPLQKAVAAARYDVYSDGCSAEGKLSYSAENPAQGFAARFDGTSFTAQSGKAEGVPWKLTMRPVGVGYGEQTLSASAGEIAPRGDRIEIARVLSGSKSGAVANRLLEWYLNRPSGIEQGFTLSERPAGGNGVEPLRLFMEWSGDLTPKLIGEGGGIALERSKGRQTLVYDRLSVIDVAGNKLASRFEVKGHDVAIVVEDRDASYPLTIDPVLTQVAELTASDGAEGDFFGYSVSTDGETAVVGAFGKTVGGNSYQGAVYVFERNSGGADNWGQAKILTASDGTPDDQFGASVAIDGDTAVVGANNKTVGGNSGQGVAYVFGRNSRGADNWGQVVELTASDGTAGDAFGFSVSIDGDTAIVGAAQKTVGVTSGQGAAYVFERNSGGADNWGKIMELTASDGVAGDLFGWSVANAGDTAVVGAYRKTVGGNFSQGAAYVFERNSGGAGNWGQIKILTDPDGTASDEFGWSVAINGDTAVVGAPYKNSYQGAAYVFGRNAEGADNWGQVKELTASDGAASDFFGISVSVDGDTAVVGALINSFFQGAAYLFGHNARGSDNWGQVQELTASDGALNDSFGGRVSIRGDTAIVGAYYKTVGGNFNQGAAYIFSNTRRTASHATSVGWTTPITSPVTTLTASDRAAGDQVGLKLVNPNGTTNATHTFLPQPLTDGTIMVPHQ